jgi:hypothetical protein
MLFSNEGVWRGFSELVHVDIFYMPVLETEPNIYYAVILTYPASRYY